jgi:hypothetical protein
MLSNLLNTLQLSNSLFFKNEENKFVDVSNIEIKLHFEIQKKLEIIQPDAIYVFNNQPFILFFDLTESLKKREDDVYKKVWSFGNNSPVIFVIKDKDISIYNAINFTKESEEEYWDNNRIEIDKIDIYVSNLALQKEWNENDIPYFAIECKRIEKISDASKYISDIHKFCVGNHIKIRLPFEGQITFIKNTEITHIQLKDKINEKLPTENSLNTISISDKCDVTYLSEYKHNTTLQDFSIYHLLFDYSRITIL